MVEVLHEHVFFFSLFPFMTEEETGHYTAYGAEKPNPRDHEHASYNPAGAGQRIHVAVTNGGDGRNDPPQGVTGGDNHGPG